MPIFNQNNDDLQKRGPFIVTFTGRHFHPFDPSPDEVILQDIAHSLALKCRYTGHCSRFYSVAQHSVLVAALVPVEYRKEALLHDAAEAYLADLAFPLKNHERMAGFQLTERDILCTVFQKFGLTYPGYLSPAVAAADRQAMDVEWSELMPSERMFLGNPENPVLYSVPAAVGRDSVRRLPSLTPTGAEESFLKAFGAVFIGE